MDSDDERLRQFDREMQRIYERAANEVGYRATRFLQMLSERGGLSTARHLLNGPPSDGLGRLMFEGRLDLAIESLVQQADFRSLFTEQELRTAVERVGDRSGEST
ncbi:MAG: hypothetical protein O3A10_07435 [Chloroflexi bacterium]|nr:hypothetical protein [Chloroflexota bacterium]MDA1145700.1 hypothetical protein [Chloroflexota bacterium]